MSEWRPIETAPKCDLNPYDTRSSDESRYVLVWNGLHVGVGYFLIDDSDLRDGGFWCAEDEQFVVPAPTHWMPLPEPPKVTHEQ